MSSYDTRNEFNNFLLFCKFREIGKQKERARKRERESRKNKNNDPIN